MNSLWNVNLGNVSVDFFLGYSQSTDVLFSCCLFVRMCSRTFFFYLLPCLQYFINFCCIQKLMRFWPMHSFAFENSFFILPPLHCGWHIPHSYFLRVSPVIASEFRPGLAFWHVFQNDSIGQSEAFNDFQKVSWPKTLFWIIAWDNCLTLKTFFLSSRKFQLLPMNYSLIYDSLFYKQSFIWICLWYSVPFPKSSKFGTYIFSALKFGNERMTKGRNFEAC